MSLLFSSLTIKSIRLRNRIAVSPMCQYSSQDGYVTDWHLVHLGSRAVGGAGLVIQEATAVTQDGRITYGDAGIYRDEHVEGLKRITTFLKSQGAVAGIQLAHAGRKASCELPWISDKQIKTGSHHWQTVAPSPLPFRPDDQPPRELTIPEIQDIVLAFQAAAKRAYQAGYEVIELHAAHGYLINEFLSPLSNQRTDDYGGSFENRIQFLLEILEAVQKEWPADLPVFVRISAVDWMEGGWTIEDSVKLVDILKSKGVDLIDASSGGISPDAKIPAGPNYQVPFSAQIKKETGILTGAVGIIVEASQAEAILTNQEADLVLIAREHLRDPYFALHAAKELGDDIAWPNQYLRAKR